MTASAANSIEDTLVIVGIGLIGGSIAAAARKRGVARRILGAGRNPQRLEQAQSAGLIDAVATDATSLGNSPFVAICTPVDRIALDAATWLARIPSDGLVTDAGSTKRRICASLAAWVEQKPTYIGSHPIAGSEKQGFENSDATLYEGKTCVITPMSGHRSADVARLSRFWESLGMQVVALSPAEHDRALAATSHVPHVVAAALAEGLRESDRGLTGTGFASTTRIAAGDPDLWTAILQENAEDVADELAAVQHRLAAYEHALRTNDTATLKSLLQTAKTNRDQLDA